MQADRTAQETCVLGRETEEARTRSWSAVHPHVAPEPAEKAGASLDADSLRWLGALLLLVATGRCLALSVSAAPLFIPDSATYLHAAHDPYLPVDRPAGTSFFYRAVLALRHDLRALVLAQSLVGVATSAIFFVVARGVGLGPRLAFTAAAVASLAPSTLLFERAMMSESLSQLATATSGLLLLLALRRPAPVVFGLLGGSLAGGILVRSAAIGLLPAVILSLLAFSTRDGERVLRRWVAFGLLLVLPLVGYAFAARREHGRLGITFFDGVSLFGITAGLTNCSDPEAAPAIRRAVCAEPGYLERAPDAVIWNDGPVQRELRDRGWPRVNAELRRLSLESIATRPSAFLAGCVGRLLDTLAAHDPPYHLHPIDARIGDVVAEDFHLDLRNWPRRDRPSHWNDLLTAWHRLRWLAWAGLAIACLSVVSRPRSHADDSLRALLLLAMFTVAVVTATSYGTPRLLFPIEWIAWIAAASLPRDRRVGDS